MTDHYDLTEAGLEAIERDLERGPPNPYDMPPLVRALIAEVRALRGLDTVKALDHANGAWQAQQERADNLAEVLAELARAAEDRLNVYTPARANAYARAVQRARDLVTW